jgi:NADH-quinone oxidoreductase subunit L
LKKDLPITYWTFLIGAIAIAGVPGLAGFFSKDEILYRTFVSGHTMLWAVGMMTSLMTAFYMFRLVFLAFHGERRAAPAGAHAAHDHHPDAESHDAHHAPHLHDAPPAMAIPLVVLALGSVVAGYLNLPAGLGGSAFLEHFLEPSLHVPVVEGAHAAAEHANHSLELTLMAVSSVVALIGIGLAAFLYLKRPALPEALAARFPGAYQFLVHKGYVDELYDAVVVQPVKALSEGVLWRFDANVVDGAVNGAGRIVVETGSVVRQIQTGSMRAYAVSVLLGVVMIVGYYLWS